VVLCDPDICLEDWTSKDVIKLPHPTDVAKTAAYMVLRERKKVLKSDTNRSGTNSMSEAESSTACDSGGEGSNSSSSGSSSSSSGSESNSKDNDSSGNDSGKEDKSAVILELQAMNKLRKGSTFVRKRIFLIEDIINPEITIFVILNIFHFS
jgi:hypothetical protein